MAESNVLENTKPSDLQDYKFFCFNGEPKFYIYQTRLIISLLFEYRLDEGWIWKKWLWAPNWYTPKPDNLDEMLDVARKLSIGKAHVRVDLYNVDSHIYFGELTFYTGAGFIPFEPKEYDYVLGEMLNLPSGGVK